VSRVSRSTRRSPLTCRLSNASSLDSFLSSHDLIRRGDIVGVTGLPSRTKAGELSLQISELKLLSPCLHQLPGREGVVDQETKYRKRYLDLIMNPTTRDVFVARSKVVNYIRKFLDNLGFLEVSKHP
jgi:lysyl-tRNA synthetase class 2